MTKIFGNFFYNHLRAFLRKGRLLLTSNERVETQSQEQQQVVNVSSVFEPYFLKIQHILIWKNPLLSLFTITLINILFWFVVSFEIRFYSLFFLSLLGFCLYDDWLFQRLSMNIFPMNLSAQTLMSNNTENDEYSSRMITFSEFNQILSNSQACIKENYQRFKRLREEQPGLFCSSLCLIFFLLSVIGRNVSGLTLIYGIFMLILITPGILFHMPKTRLRPVCLKRQTHDTDSEVEEYLPETTCETLSVLHLAGNAQIKDDDSRESTTHDSSGPQGLSSLSAEIASGHLSLEGSIDGLDLDLELNNAAPNEVRLLDPNISESDTDEEITGMKFQSKHFNGDGSSSSEDEAFSKGLTFTEQSLDKTQQQKQDQQSAPETTSSTYAAYDFAKGIASTVISSVFTLEPNIPETPSKDSSSECGDDFEIISTDELS